jgi:hypothetical protein
MDGFLVVLSHLMDDVPVALFASREAAISAADAWIPADGTLPKKLRKVFPTDSAPLCLRLVEFVSGMPVKCEVLKDYEDQPVTA